MPHHRLPLALGVSSSICSRLSLAPRRRRVRARSMSSIAEYFKRIDVELHQRRMMTGSFRDFRFRRCHPHRRQSHLEDADQHLPRQSRHQDRQCAVCPRHCGARRARGNKTRAHRRTVRDARTHRADPANRPSLKATNDTSYTIIRSPKRSQPRAASARDSWPVIDVTRRSIEETAATVIDLYRAHRLKFIE